MKLKPVLRFIWNRLEFVHRSQPIAGCPLTQLVDQTRLILKPSIPLKPRPCWWAQLLPFHYKANCFLNSFFVQKRRPRTSFCKKDSPSGNDAWTMTRKASFDRVVLKLDHPTKLPVNEIRRPPSGATKASYKLLASLLTLIARCSLHLWPSGMLELYMGAWAQIAWGICLDAYVYGSIALSIGVEKWDKMRPLKNMVFWIKSK